MFAGLFWSPSGYSWPSESSFKIARIFGFAPLFDLVLSEFIARKDGNSGILAPCSTPACRRAGLDLAVYCH